MKYIIIALLFGVPLMAEDMYKVPNSNSATGFVEVGYTKEKGITIYYPKEYSSKIMLMPSGSIYINESMCKSIVRIRVEEILKISSREEQDRQIEARLFDTRDNLVVVANYFPFIGKKFSESIKTYLLNQGVDKLHYKYPSGNPRLLKSKIILKPGSLTAMLNTYDYNKTVNMSNSEMDSDLYIGTQFLPLACDFINKKASVDIQWDMSIMPFNNVWVELLSKNQVYNIYSQMKDKQDYMPVTSQTGKNVNAFIQGAIAGESFQDQAASLNKDNLGVFSRLIGYMVNISNYSLKYLTSDDIDRVYGKLMINQTRPIQFSGVAHAK